MTCIRFVLPYWRSNKLMIWLYGDTGLVCLLAGADPAEWEGYWLCLICCEWMNEWMVDPDPHSGWSVVTVGMRMAWPQRHLSSVSWTSHVGLNLCDSNVWSWILSCLDYVLPIFSALNPTLMVAIRHYSSSYILPPKRRLWLFFCRGLYASLPHCVPKKNFPDIFNCILKTNYQILIIFGTDIPDTTCHQMFVQFPT